MYNDDINENVFRETHFSTWNNNLGKNFTDNGEFHQQGMQYKNMETGGAYQASVSGDYGEFTASSVLKSLPDYYAVMDDILLQTGIKYRLYQPEKYGPSPWKLVQKKGKVYEEVHKSTQLDHLIVSPFGIFVIETKNHKGWVFGDVNGKVWTQVLKGDAGWRAYGGHSHYTFFNPVWQNMEHIKHLSKECKIPSKFMTGMIVFTNPDAHLGNVNCSCCYTLDMLYAAIMSYNNQLFDKRMYDKIIKRIEEKDSNRYTLEKEHIMYVKDLQHRHEINSMRKRMGLK